MNDEKQILGTVYWGDKKVADLSSEGIRTHSFDLNEVSRIDYDRLDNGYILDTSRIFDKEYPYRTRVKHKEKTRGEWVTIANAPSYIAARVAHRIWLYALGGNDALIDAYVINQIKVESEDES